MNRNCKICSSEFVIYPYQIKKGFGNFCSHKCFSKNRMKIATTYCKNCNKKIKDIPIRKRKYCSRKCYWKFLTTLENEGGMNWQGNKVGYHGIHDWLRKNFGKASKCENKKCSGKSSTYQWASKNGKYIRNKDEFWQLCRSCHNIFDINNPKRPIIKK